MNTQAAWLPDFNLHELPEDSPVSLGAAEGDYALAANWIREAAEDCDQGRGWRT